MLLPSLGTDHLDVIYPARHNVVPRCCRLTVQLSMEAAGGERLSVFAWAEECCRAYERSQQLCPEPQ